MKGKKLLVLGLAALVLALAVTGCSKAGKYYLSSAHSDYYDKDYDADEIEEETGWDAKKTYLELKSDKTFAMYIDGEKVCKGDYSVDGDSVKLTFKGTDGEKHKVKCKVNGSKLTIKDPTELQYVDVTGAATFRYLSNLELKKK